MITIKDLNEIIGKRIGNEIQKAILRNKYPIQIADRMCAAIDGQERVEHFTRFVREWNEWEMRRQAVMQAVREIVKGK